LTSRSWRAQKVNKRFRERREMCFGKNLRSSKTEVCNTYSQTAKMQNDIVVAYIGTKFSKAKQLQHNFLARTNRRRALGLRLALEKPGIHFERTQSPAQMYDGNQY
jgi:hypothetical protein